MYPGGALHCLVDQMVGLQSPHLVALLRYWVHLPVLKTASPDVQRVTTTELYRTRTFLTWLQTTCTSRSSVLAGIFV